MSEIARALSAGVSNQAVSKGTGTDWLDPKEQRLLRFFRAAPFIRDMTGPISPGTASAQYSIAVAEKQLSAEKEQGQQAVQLIESATPAVPPAGTGKHVNLRA